MYNSSDIFFFFFFFQAEDGIRDKLVTGVQTCALPIYSVEEFAADLEDLDVAIRPPRTEQIAVRLYKDDLDILRSLAAKHGVGHTTLARTVLEGWLARSRSRRRHGPGRKARRPA